MMSLTKLSVQPGKHDFKPNIHPWLISKKKTRCEFEFELGESMWYPINDPSYPHGSYNGWNKLGFGYTQGLFSNSKRSCMVAEFPFQGTPGITSVALYINDKSGNWDATEIMKVKTGVKYMGFLQWYRYQVVLHIREKDNQTNQNTVSMKLTRSNWLPLRGIGAWHGGKYPAHIYREFFASLNYI